jgi:hypothetical protein
MRNPHTPIDQLILDSKDLSMFPITRVAQGWQVIDQREGFCHHPRIFKTKRAAQVAICSVVRQAMS